MKDIRHRGAICKDVPASHIRLIAWLLFSGTLVARPVIAERLHTIEVTDATTGRGVPLVNVTIADQRLVTDSAGIVAVDDPAILDQNVSLHVKSYGYQGLSRTISTTAGGHSTLSIQRVNLAERVYRVTGTGIYQHSVQAGRPTPIDQPLLNANVRGQDSVQTAIYRGKIHWVWGDTKYEHGFGNFRAAGATSDLPAEGGLPPSEGVNLSYYVNASGSAREMMPLVDPGAVWLDGLFTVCQPNGDERMLAHFIRLKSLEPLVLYEQGLALFDDSSKTFMRFQNYDLDAPVTPAGHAFRYRDGGHEYICFAQSYPHIRVRANWADITDIGQWEAFTPLRENSRYDAADPPLDIGPHGKPVFGWKKNTHPLTPEMINELVQRGHLRREETPFRLRERGTGQEIHLHRSSVHWNEFRDKWIMIGTQLFGTSCLGEVWFAEATTPTGPWENAIQVATHHDESDKNYSFYNPTSHPFFDEEGGRVIYFEGTYSHKFSGNPRPTPLYDYNQIMYRLDLSTLPQQAHRSQGKLKSNGSKVDDGQQ